MSARTKTIVDVLRGWGFLTGVVIVIPLVLLEHLRAVLALSGGAGV